MPKMKTKSGAAKRFKKTAGGLKHTRFAEHSRETFDAALGTA
ncbi:50S ribosomal protein L35, partial [Pseudomonas aeruginosa]